MDNHGKSWSIDHDQKLVESPQLSNTYFSQTMGRSENAIKFRRSHLAAKMHQNDPATSLEEYVGLMHGDLDHAKNVLFEWNEKRVDFQSFLDANKKRKLEPAAPVLADQISRYFNKQGARPASEPAADIPTYWHDQSPEERVATICQSIREEGGNLASIFNDPQYLPILVQHYPGFEAYARVVQARATGGSV